MIPTIFAKFKNFRQNELGLFKIKEAIICYKSSGRVFSEKNFDTTDANLFMKCIRIGDSFVVGALGKY